ncbi:MAG: histone deacetylase [Acidobacteriia bacterium]|nr:histone deacetylase [Terriglobia bacterium]
MGRPGFLIDDRFRLHDPGGGHPESSKRLLHIQQALDAFGIAGRWRRIEARAAPAEQLELIHCPGHIERVKRASEQAPSYLDPDTPVSIESYATALLAAGSILACVDAICDGYIDRAFAFVRPPGHHAEPDRAMGFCLFNNVALGAAYLRSEHKLERVAVVDIDVHHGNGTQACFYDDPNVLYVSTHQYPYFPGTGSFGELGVGDGWGYTLNFPLPAGTADSAFVPIYARIVSAVLDQYQPQFILVSAGFDALLGDPLGGLAVSAAGYASVAASLLKAADRCCRGRICFVLEGGYSPAGLRECTKAVLTEMESDDPKELALSGDSLFEAISQEVGEWIGERWKW